MRLYFSMRATANPCRPFKAAERYVLQHPGTPCLKPREIMITIIDDETKCLRYQSFWGQGT